jgi:hypothetical protein
MSKKNLRSSIDDFPRKEGIFEEARAQAVEEVAAWQLAQAMKKKKISKARMAVCSRRAGRKWIGFSIRKRILHYRVCSGLRRCWGGGLRLSWCE